MYCIPVCLSCPGSHNNTIFVHISPRESNTSSLLSHQDIDRSMRIPDEDYSILPVQWRTHPFYAPHLSGTSIVKVEEPAPKKYYMLPIVRSYAVKVSFDRLKLLALLDRYGVV